MSDFKEFQGKTLDAAIAEACAYYDAPREKLEIDIVEDAKSGIFGLVGARKARIRARRAQLPPLGGRGKNRRASVPTPSDAPDAAVGTDGVMDEPKESEPARKARRSDKPAPNHRQAAAETTPEAPAENAPEADAEVPAEAAPVREPRRGRSPRVPRAVDREADTPDDTQAKTADKCEKPEDAHDVESESGLPRVALADLDQDRLIRIATDMVSRLVFPIVGEVPLEVSVGEDRVQVRVDCEDTGLLIGREGQNLAAVQYLAARMVARAVGAQVRVQVDAGDYHSRQDSRLQELARALADKVRATGRSQSTRPLSAYQRRVIHLTLQDDPDVQTRSSGEGPLKRVVILRRKD